jgi:hypothetical protein
MFAADKPSPFPGEMCGFDNLAFHYYLKGKEFDDPTCCGKGHGTYEFRMNRMIKTGVTPMLAIPPDIVGGGQKSLDMSLAWAEKMPDHWPLYLAVQNGMTPKQIEGVIRYGFAGIFLGGDDEFKKEAPAWCEFAHSFGLKFHYARAGTPDKIKAAQLSGADSLDSAFPLWTIQRFYGFRKMLTQEMLFPCSAPSTI